MRIIAGAFVSMALLTTFPAAAEADSWCMLWKNEQMCVSVEDFRMFAKRICLQARARENPTAEESIALHRECEAAMIMANKAQQAKAAHERALAAQKELDAIPR